MMQLRFCPLIRQSHTHGTKPLASRVQSRGLSTIGITLRSGSFSWQCLSWSEWFKCSLRTRNALKMEELVRCRSANSPSMTGSSVSAQRAGAKMQSALPGSKEWMDSKTSPSVSLVQRGKTERSLGLLPQTSRIYAWFTGTRTRRQTRRPTSSRPRRFRRCARSRPRFLLTPSTRTSASLMRRAGTAAPKPTRWLRGSTRTTS
mmetsp:Transcript_26897/g.54065  ORF Transcript_26897/g.54065 Transcript_26897/m.54065 type:complete len:203 (+) Transcript_26897:254-862(+)